MVKANEVSQTELLYRDVAQQLEELRTLRGIKESLESTLALAIEKRDLYNEFYMDMIHNGTLRTHPASYYQGRVSQAQEIINHIERILA